MDHNQLEDIAKRVKSAGAEQVELLFVNSTDVSTSIRRGKQESLERSEHQAIGMRVWVGQSQSIVSSDDLAKENLDSLVENAVAIAKASPPDPHVSLAPRERWASDAPDLELFDATEPEVATLEEQCRAAEDAAFAVKGVTNSEGAAADFGHAEVSLLISPADGAPFVQGCKSSSYSLSVSVLAGEGTGMEEDYEYATRRFASDLPDAASLGKKAGERVVTRLKPESIATCQIPIIWEPRVGRSLLSNFLRAINGSSVARGSSFLKDKMGEELFNSAIEIVDDPYVKRGLASQPFDDEGVAGEKLKLIENGALKHWLLDMRSANKLGLKSNGRAHRGLSSPPAPGSTNTYMQAGSISPKDMLAGVDRGLLVTDTFGMGVNLVTGDYSQGARGFLIESGEIAGPVSEITIAGNLLEMFKQLTPASDLTFEYSTNVPTLRIDGMTVAGS